MNLIRPKNTNLFFSFSTVAILLAFNALADTTKSKTSTAATADNSLECAQKDGTVEFFAIGKPSMLKIHGTSQANQGKIVVTTAKDGETKLTGSFTVKLDTLDTGMDMRNKHMKEKTFETDKFPDSKFTLENVTIPKDSKDKKVTTKFNGKLTFHGVEKPIAGDVDVTLHDKSVDYDATFPVKLTDFGCTIPAFAGMTLQDDVKVEAKGTAQK
jgi:polyisoprenoid-binding protein YceI